MKTAVFASLVASAAAFAPAAQRATVQTSHAMSSELEGMLGADVETGGRIVSTWATFCYCCGVRKVVVDERSLQT